MRPALLSSVTSITTHPPPMWFLHSNCHRPEANCACYLLTPVYPPLVQPPRRPGAPPAACLFAAASSVCKTAGTPVPGVRAGESATRGHPRHADQESRTAPLGMLFATFF